MERISTIIPALFFISFELYFLIALFVIITNRVIIYRIKKKHPKVWIYKFTFMSFWDFKPLTDVYRIMLHFGNKQTVKHFVSHFIDIDSVEKLTDAKMQNYVNVYFFMISILAKLWCIMLGALGFLGLMELIK